MKEYIKTRDDYIELIRRELYGPGSEVSIPDKEHEIVTTTPEVRYSIGVLFPKNNKLNADNDEDARIEESRDEAPEIDEEETETVAGINEHIEQTAPAEEENLDEEIGLATQNMPSSMGYTFLVNKNIDTLKCKVSFATYRKATMQDCRVPFYPENPDAYEVPTELAHLIAFDKKENTLKLCSGLNRKDVSQIKEKDKEENNRYSLLSAMYKLCDQLKNGYVRIPHLVPVTVSFINGDYSDNNKELDGTKAKITALKRRVNNTLYSITVMMVNDSEEKSNGTRCLFQPEIRIETSDNDFSFAEYSSLVDFQSLTPEEQSLELQYRNKHNYGTGLGTSVEWTIDQNGKGMIQNEFFPSVEVPNMDFSIPEKYEIDKTALSMRFLSDLDKTEKEEKIRCLKTVIMAYATWIDKKTEEKDKLESRFKAIAESNINGCSIAKDRMLAGLKTLADNETAWTAFLLANRAMFMQRVHIMLQMKTSDQDRYPDDEELASLLEAIDYADMKGYTADVHNWRLFQIAFLLMSVDSIVKDTGPDRDIVDLIWFPTGGGKTEAYLGLTAFAIFYRRLAHGAQAGGTAVFMRYTLRLLAAQQFTRAATLICACEYIRKDATSRKPKYGSYLLGNDAITIGLWIGSEHIPNTNSKAKGYLKELLDAQPGNLKYAKEQNNKFQVLKCPWCGTKMVRDSIKTQDKGPYTTKGTFGYRMRNNSHFELFCPQESCFFNQQGRLPIQIIDEELYSNPPTLLFGTVDKFALLPWKKDIGAFFGVGTTNRAPELIIQDELHLISGPLGTMVGLYEAAIDAICSSKGIRTKIIASTATIRRAKEQCMALYDRNVMQFPHPGLDAEDSFFAREAGIDYDKGFFGRKYIGLMPAGKTKAMMEVRSIAALMQKINTMELPEQIKDKYWTLTVYFNSLRDLGKCSTLVEDDVKDFIKRTAYRLGDARDARRISSADELTSRVTTTDLNATLDKLEKVAYSKENFEKKRYPSNILLATNMISVGIDVARLNVMLMVGQPKLTSEYIQASSRVGRSYPGVAFVMYDGSKSRDRSHYEQFKSYHDSFYKYVEPTGATPFSEPARERALHAVVIAMLRMTEEGLSKETDAADFSKEKYEATITRIKNYLTARAADIIKNINPEMSDESANIAEEIDSIIDTWERLAKSYGRERFTYGEKYIVRPPADDFGRLLKPYNGLGADGALNTMTSMRSVDATIAGNILNWEVRQ